MTRGYGISKQKYDFPPMSERGVEEKIRNEYYKNTRDYQKIFGYIEEVQNTLTALGSYFLAAERAGLGTDAFAPGILKKLRDELNNYKFALEARKDYYKEDNRLHDLFRSDLEKEFGVQGNPKKDVLFSKAYDKGHSGGYEEVYNVYSDLVELIK